MNCAREISAAILFCMGDTDGATVLQQSHNSAQKATVPAFMYTQHLP